MECAHLVADAVPLLSNLLNHHDQKLLEYVCLAFSRLAESFADAPAQLEMLAAQALLPSLLRLLGGMVVGANAQADAPVSVSDATYTMLLKTLATLVRGSASLCKQLLQLDVSSVLRDFLAADEADGCAPFTEGYTQHRDTRTAFRAYAPHRPATTRPKHFQVHWLRPAPHARTVTLA